MGGTTESQVFMSFEITPTAVTDTATTDPNTGQAEPRKSGLAALMEPVQPVYADTDTDSDSAADTKEGADEKAVGGSSAEYKAEDGDDTSGDDASGNGKQSKSVVRAWLLAGAQRWGKGGGTANKRLELAKAKAQSRQLKTTESVNRTAGLGGLLAGGARNSNGSATKSPSGGSDKGSKSGRGGSGRTNTGGGSGRGGAGTAGPNSRASRTNSGAKGPSGSSGTGSGSSGRSGSGSGGRNNSPKAKQDKDSKGSNDKGLNKPRTHNGVTNGPARTTKTPGGKDGHRPWRDRSPKSNDKPGKDKPAPGSAGATQATKSPKNSKTSDNRKQPADLTKNSKPDPSTSKTDRTAPSPKTTPGPKPKPSAAADKRREKEPRPWHRTPTNTKGPDDLNTPKLRRTTDTKKDDTKKDDTKQADTKKESPGKPPPKPADLVKKAFDLTKKPKTGPDDKKPDQPKPDLKKPDRPAARKPTLPRRTQKARETGYRHGTHIGDATAQAQAYRDGVKDGIKARTDNARREKSEMDTIHVRRTQQQEDKPVTTAAPTAPTQIPATRVGNDIHLGPGAARTSMSSGEVRNMKDFQDRLTVKAYALQWRAEDLKAKKTKLAELAKRALELVEKEKALATGGKSINAAARASASISALDASASVLLARLMRAIDETSAVKSNTETRYGQIYKAVADSDEQAPANNLAYYADKGA